MDKRISQKLRDDIYAYSMQLVEKTKYETEFMNLLSSLWDVYNMPKREDIRFSNLGDEIEKHFVINDDWSQEKLFNSIFKLKEDEDLKAYGVDAYAPKPVFFSDLPRILSLCPL